MAMMGRHAILLWALASGPASACSCSSYEPVKACQIYHSTEVVFRGRVIDHNEIHGAGFRQKTLYRFRVLESFKGLSTGVSEVFIDPASGSSCYRPFELERDYLVMTNRSRSTLRAPEILVAVPPGGLRKPYPRAWLGREDLPVFEVGVCSPSKSIGEGDADLAFLRGSGKDNPRAAGWIEGSVVQNLAFSGSAADAMAVGDATVTVTVPAGFRKTVTADRQGRFRIEPVPPGRFDLLVESKVLGIARWFPGVRELNIPAGGCAIINASYNTGAVISGNVLDVEGRPARGIRMELGELRDNGTVRIIRGTWQDTGPNGSFTMRNVPVGRIVLGANLSGVPQRRMPFLPVYVPGTGNISEARVFTVKPNEEIGNIELRLPRPLPFGELFVTVLWADGSPVLRGAVVQAQEGKVDVGIERTSDPAPVRVPLAIGRRYNLAVRGRLSQRYDSPVTDRSVEFTHHGQTLEVRLDAQAPK